MSDEKGGLEIVQCQHKIDGTDVDYYKNAATYWEGVDGTVNGMLGGFGKVSDVDIDGSNKLLKTLFKVTFSRLQSQPLLFTQLPTIEQCVLKKNTYVLTYSFSDVLR